MYVSISIGLVPCVTVTALHAPIRYILHKAKYVRGHSFIQGTGRYSSQHRIEIHVAVDIAASGNVISVLQPIVRRFCCPSRPATHRATIEHVIKAAMGESCEQEESQHSRRNDDEEYE